MDESLPIDEEVFYYVFRNNESLILVFFYFVCNSKVHPIDEPDTQTTHRGGKQDGPAGGPPSPICQP